MPEADGPTLLRHEPREPEPSPAPLQRPRDGGDRTSVGPLDRRTLLVSATGLAAGTVAAGAVLLRTRQGVQEVVAPANTPTVPAVTATPSATATATAPATATAKPAAASPFALAKNLDPALLVARVTYGRTAAVEADVERLGATAWLSAQLAPKRLDDPEGDRVRALFPRLGWSTAKVRRSVASGDWAVMTDVAVAHVGQAAWSRRQLQEVIVDFWSNVLNVTCPSSDVWDSRHRYDLDVIRTHALGRFEDLLLASAVHPSMLAYLDNADSTAASPNENYAREVLELHTVGVDAGYTEKDVHRAALLLTGWELRDGVAAFRPDRHHTGPVRVMGFEHANSTASDGRAAQAAYLRYLARHPATAANVARKLAVRFVSDAPPTALVKRLAAVYTAEGTSIAPVLQALFASPEFTASAGEKVRRPFESRIADVRALGVRTPKVSQGIVDLYWNLSATGHQPLAWAPPNGYPDTASAWQSPAAALAQFNATTGLVRGWWPTALALPGPEKLLATAPTSRTAAVDAVARKVLGRAPRASEKSAAAVLLKGTKLPTAFTAGSWEQKETVALVATLLLSSPAHLTR